MKGEEGSRKWTQRHPKSGWCHDTSRTEEPQSDPKVEMIDGGIKERIARWEREREKVKEGRGEEKKEGEDPTSPKSFTELWWKTRAPSWTETIGAEARGKAVRGRGGIGRGVGGRGKRERGGIVTGEEDLPATPKIKRLEGN